VFHDTFADNEDEVCDALVEGVKNNFEVISKPNLAETVTVLRELKRHDAAEALIDFAETHGDKEFWTSDDPFGRAINDARLIEITKQRREAAKPVFDFESDLVLAAKNMDDVKRSQVAAVPVEQYQSLFESRSGEQLRRLILSALDYRRILNASDDMMTIVHKAEAALRAIAKKSKLNELRVQKYGISIEAEEEKAGEEVVLIDSATGQNDLSSDADQS